MLELQLDVTRRRAIADLLEHRGRDHEQQKQSFLDVVKYPKGVHIQIPMAASSDSTRSNAHLSTPAIASDLHGRSNCTDELEQVSPVRLLSG